MKIIRYKSGVTHPDSDENTVLALARCGGAPFQQPNDSDFARLIDEINNRIVKIHIPWFWKHDVASEFFKKHVNSLDIDALLDVLSQTKKKCLKRDIHWVEDVNLFHLYGLLCRATGDKMLSKNCIAGLANQEPLALSSLSARNCDLILNRADAEEAADSINYMRDKNKTRTFAEYQLYYYGGIDAVMKMLDEYVESDKESIVPTTVFSLMNTFELEPEDVTFLHDQIISRLKENAKKLITT